MKNLLSFLILLAATSSIQAQDLVHIRGTVIDSASREPLFSASVFCQNTTQGTASNKEGRFYLGLKPGGYDLVITYTGYRSKLIPISQSNEELLIEMVKEEKNIEEVVIRSSNEVKNGWERYGQFFLDNFIGSTPFSKQCTLENPGALKFYYYRKSDKLKVLAEEPILVRNEALGYLVRYNLDSFLYHYKTDLSSYSGFAFYEELPGTADSIAYWKQNRVRAYQGSRLHFMHSYFDSTVNQEGFVIAMLDEKDDLKFNRIWNPYDSTYYGFIDSTMEADLYYPRKISITYTRRTPENEYLSKYKLPMDIGVQTSYIDMLDLVTIRQNGYYYHQQHWVNSGYWSWKNLADQLPFDYLPD